MSFARELAVIAAAALLAFALPALAQSPTPWTPATAATVNSKLGSALAAVLGDEITLLDVEEGAKGEKVLDQIHLRAWNLWKGKVTVK